MKTTIKRVWEFNPCDSNWDKHIQHINLHHLLKENISDPTDIPDCEILMRDVLEVNGLQNALWLSRVPMKDYSRELLMYMAWYVQQAQYLMKDHRSIEAVDVVYRYAKGEAGNEVLKMVYGDARDAFHELEEFTKEHNNSSSWSDASQEAGARGAHNAARAALRLVEMARSIRDLIPSEDPERINTLSSRAADAAVDAAQSVEDALYAVTVEALTSRPVPGAAELFLKSRNRPVLEFKHLLECTEQGLSNEIAN